MKKIIITSAITLALGLSACSEQKTPEQLLISAQQFSEEGKFGYAIIDYKNAVRLSPKNLDARLGLGIVYLKQGNYISAEKELDKTLELEGNFSQIAPYLAQVKAKLVKFSDIEALVKKSDELADSDYLIVLTYAGMAALSDGQLTKAQDYFSQASTISAGKPYSVLSTAYLHYIDKEYTEGLNVVNQLLADEANFSEASLLQAYIHFSTKDYELASGAFQRFLNQYPQDNKVRFQLTDSLIKSENFEEASVLTEQLLKAFKNSPLVLEFKAQLEYHDKNYSEARDFANKVIYIDEKSIIGRLIAGVSSYELGDIEQAYTHLRVIDEYLNETSPVKQLFDVTKLKLGYYNDTTEQLFQLDVLSDDESELLTSTTNKLISIGELDKALQLIDRSKKLPRKFNGETLTLSDQQLAIAVRLLKQNKDAEAQVISDELKRDEENEYLGLLLQGIIHVKQNDKAKAEQYFEQVLLLKPNNVASLYNLARLKQESNQMEAALGFYKRVISISPNHLGALKNILRMSEDEKIQGQIVELLYSYDYKHNLQINLTLAQVLRLNGMISKAITVLKEISSEETLNASYYLSLGDNYIQTNQIEQALEAFSLGLAIAPKNYLLNIRYIGILSGKKDYSTALIQARKAYSYHPDIERLTVLLTHLEAKNNNLPQVKKLLAKLKHDNVSHHLLDTITGEVALLEKRYPEAVEALSSAYEVEPTQNNLIGLARSLVFSGKSNEAKELLESFIELNPENKDVRLLLAGLYTDTEREKKIVQYSYLVKLSPDNALLLNNLAWNQYKIGQKELALKNIEKAITIPHDNIAIQESYGVILVANEKMDQAIPVLESVINKGSVNAEVQESLQSAKQYKKEHK